MMGHAKTETTEKAYLPWVEELHDAHIEDAPRSAIFAENSGCSGAASAQRGEHRFRGKIGRHICLVPITQLLVDLDHNAFEHSQHLVPPLQAAVRVSDP